MVDIRTQLDAVTRSLTATERDGERENVQTLAQTYPSTLADVWEAVTTADRIARWFSPVTGDLELGGRYQIEGNAGGTILACDPPVGGSAGYRITWEFGGGTSWVAIVLQSVDDAHTRLELIHTARVGDLPPEFWETYGPGATGVGWDLSLLGLALYLGTGVGMAPDEAEAWAIGDEGSAFARESADGWAQAHISAGGDPVAARRSADATWAFFTGRSAP
ncbi:SRPBCC domain-containing protein [Microbacterium pygmaeum]|uniref:Activator of Hsp90 ATPase homolog 1-like protein n=1 Tax=Microbacterium pygmaeum TaxID=370764 RepID=A0A1G7WW55_9MICO|nr:SRPBCC domain-containing protein [Microbacterium pygmaeum]SDG76175.1 Activator of Hsp90 ATPase homolog 1-like protein [Microbacterium pygmaeum]